MICNGCKGTIEDSDKLKCRLCHGLYHYQCLNMKRNQYLSLSKEYLATWTCCICKNVTRRKGSNIDTPVRASPNHTSEITMNMSFETIDNVQSTQLAPSIDKTCVTMDKISELLDQKFNSLMSQFMQDFRLAIKEDIRVMVKCEVEAALGTLKVEMLNDSNIMQGEQSSIKNDLELKTKTIQHLEDENSRLQQELVTISQRLTIMDKLSRSCNIEIQAVPESSKENVIDIFKKLCEVLSLNITDENIHACRRVAKSNPASNRPRNLLVTLSSPRLRDIILSAVYRYNRAHRDCRLNSRDLGISVDIKPIYVAEHLSLDQKSLHAATRKLAKEHGYKYTWVRFGNIYVRKDDSAGAIHIKNTDFLQRII